MPDKNIDLVDIDFLLLIIRGYTSSYAIWSHIKKEAKAKGIDNTNLKVMAYNNVNKRIANLVEDGLLEEMKLGESMHGRKDYKVNMKGLEMLMPYISDHTESAKEIHAHMDRFNMDKQSFGALLVGKVVSEIDSASEYLVSMSRLGFAPTNTDQIRNIQQSLIRSHSQLEKIHDSLDIKHWEKNIPTPEMESTKTRPGLGPNVRLKEIRIPHSRDPYFEQVQNNMERDLGKPEIVNTELEEREERENACRREKKSKSSRVQVNPTPAKRIKTTESQKGKH